MTDNFKPQADQQSSAPTHERRDVNLKAIMISLVILVVVGVIVHFVLAGMLALFGKERNRTTSRSASQRVATSISQSRPQFPEPRLQISPPQDLALLRDREQTELNTYGWINESSGIVRIPISRAMELLVERGLPASNSVSGKSELQLIQERALER